LILTSMPDCRAITGREHLPSNFCFRVIFSLPPLWYHCDLPSASLRRSPRWVIYQYIFRCFVIYLCSPVCYQIIYTEGTQQAFVFYAFDPSCERGEEGVHVDGEGKGSIAWSLKVLIPWGREGEGCMHTRGGGSRCFRRG
jgi:hypothetical protein